MKQLLSLQREKFTKIFFCIWSMFIILHIIDIVKLVDIYNLNIMYLTADMIGKVTTTFIMHDNIEQQYTMKNNSDLQCINFISYLIGKIKKYEIHNVKKSVEFVNLTKYIKNKLNIFIPKNKKELQIELLKKILPLGFEKEYITNTHANMKMHKSFKNICILFTDIVSYTELANKFEDDVVFNLLDTIYIKFDSIIKKYSYIQKIETIGDAYMVIGDIFRDDDNYKIAVKEIILLAIDLITEIKLIKTPNNNPLSIRIGINIGSVVAGILGNEIPRLCVVGHNVNMASRLQSTAEENTIQISEDMYNIIKDMNFDRNIKFILKEGIFLKNIGSVNTYIIIPSNSS
jgi:class 3 adenylate cyclase